jgi:hypothetical protein
LGYNTNRWFDYEQLYAKYGPAGHMYMSYQGTVYRLVFNGGQNSQIRGTTIRYALPGIGWLPAVAGQLPLWPQAFSTSATSTPMVELEDSSHVGGGMQRYPPVSGSMAPGNAWALDNSVMVTGRTASLGPYGQYTATVVNATYGNGVYKAWANTWHADGTTLYVPSHAFDRRDTGAVVPWCTDAVLDAVYTSTADVSGTPAQLSIALPSAIRLGSYAMTLRNDQTGTDGTYAPGKWTVMGSTDGGTTFPILLHTVTAAAWTTEHVQTITYTVSSEVECDAYQWNFTRSFDKPYICVGEIGLFGVPAGKAAATVAAAYSLRVLGPVVTTASRKVAQLRRASDGAIEDIYADKFGVLLSTLTGNDVTAWLGNSAGYVAALYDQSGNERHMLQSTLSQQPKLVLDPASKRYVIYFSGGDAPTKTGLVCGTTFSAYGLSAVFSSMPNSSTWQTIVGANFDNAGLRSVNNTFFTAGGTTTYEITKGPGVTGYINGGTQLTQTADWVYSDLTWNHLVVSRPTEFTLLNSLGLPGWTSLYNRAFRGYMQEVVLYSSTPTAADINAIRASVPIFSTLSASAVVGVATTAAAYPPFAMTADTTRLVVGGTFAGAAYGAGTYIASASSFADELEYPPPGIPTGAAWTKDLADTLVGLDNVTYVTYKTTLAGAAYGNGAYKAWANTVLHYTAGTTYGSDEWPPSGAFDRNKAISWSRSGWGTTQNSGYINGTDMALAAFVALAMPDPIKLVRYVIRPGSSNPLFSSMAPASWIVWGSTDGGATFPHELHRVVGQPVWADDEARSFTVGARMSCNAFKLEVVRTNAALATTDHLLLGNIAWFAQTAANAPASQPWTAFGPDVSDTSTAGWTTSYNAYPTTIPGGAYSAAAFTAGALWSDTYAGEWLQLKCPEPVALTGYTLASAATGGAPSTFVLLGSNNDGTTWSLLDSQANVAGLEPFVPRGFALARQTAPFTTFRLVCTHNSGAAAYLNVRAFRLYGYPMPSVAPLVASATPAFDLGAYNVFPWTSTSTPDITARWVRSYGISSGMPFVAHMTYYNTSASPLSATLSVNADDGGTVTHNGTMLGRNDEWSISTHFAVTLVEGVNVFTFRIYNSPNNQGPALLATLMNGTTVLINTRTSTTVCTEMTPRLWLRSDELASSANNTTLAVWKGAADGANATGFAVGTASLPTVVNTEGAPFVRLGTGTSSTVNGNYFNFGSRTFNLATTGGMTIIAVVRFRSVGSYERVLDFGNGPSSDNIMLLRQITGNELRGSYYVGSTEYKNAVDTITTGYWQVAAFRFTATEQSMFKAGNIEATGASAAMTSRTLANTYVGRSNWNDAYANLDIRELQVYDVALSDAQVAALRLSLIAKYPKSLPPGALTADSTTLTREDYANGLYVASASSSNGSLSFYASKAFARSTTSFWASADNKYNASTGVYVGTEKTTVDGTDVSGEWLQIQMPVACAVTSYTFSPRLENLHDKRAPSSFVLAGSNDGATWARIDSRSGLVWTTSARTFQVTTTASPPAYTYLRIIAILLGNSGQTVNRDSVQIAFVQFMGDLLQTPAFMATTAVLKVGRLANDAGTMLSAAAEAELPVVSAGAGAGTLTWSASGAPLGVRVTPVGGVVSVSDRVATGQSFTLTAKGPVGSASTVVTVAGPSYLSSTPLNAYSTVRLVAAYTGPLLRLRRSDTSAQADVYLDAAGTVTKVTTLVGGVTTTGPSALSTWIGVGVTAYVTTWYDQGSGGIHLLQETAAMQPTYSPSANRVVFSRASASMMAYGTSSWAVSDYTFLFDYNNTSNTVATSANWSDWHGLVFADRAGQTDDWAISLAGTPTSYFGVGSVSWDPPNMTPDSGLGARSIMSASRNATTGAVKMYAGGVNVGTFADADTGGLYGPTPTYVGGKGLDAQLKTLVYYASQLSDAQVAEASMLLDPATATKAAQEYPPTNWIGAGNTWTKEMGSPVAGLNGATYHKQTYVVTGAPYGNGTYTAWANNVFNYSATTDYNTDEGPASGAFDKRVSTRNTKTGWITANATSSTIDAIDPPMLYIQLPSAIVLQRYSVQSHNRHPEDISFLRQSPSSWALEGSADGSVWTVIDTRSGFTSWTGAETKVFVVAITPAKYAYFRLVVYRNSSATNTVVTLGELRLYGTRHMPELHVKDFPPTALTGPTTGSYVASSSSFLSSDPNSVAWRAFDKSTGTYFSSASVYNTTNGIYVGDVTTTVHGVQVKGDWLQLQLPSAMLLRGYRMTPRMILSYGLTRLPTTFVLAGSNDGTTWTQVDARAGLANDATATATFVVPIAVYHFAFYRLIAIVLGNSGTSSQRNVLNVSELVLEGDVAV